MVRLEGFASDKVVDRHGLTDVGGPLFVGGVSFLTTATNLFADSCMLRCLRTEQSFRDYLEFREEAFKLAVEEMVAACDSPTDLIIQTESDEKLFQNHFFNFMALRDKYSVIVDEASRAENLSPHRAYSEDEMNHIHCKNDKHALLTKLHGVRRYYAYQKSLLEYDFIKWNSDPEEVLKWIKESTGWSALDDYELQLSLESHMKLLKRHVSELGSTSTSSSMPDEFKNVALEEINSRLSSQLEKHLQIPDMWLMQEYFNRVKIRNLARECSNQAEKAGVILVEEFLPITHLEGQMLPERLPLNLREQMKQRVKQSLESATRYLHRQGAPRSWALKALAIGAISAVSYSMLDEHKLKTVN
ncbi:unnamed protein product [Urochloa decumbens]|uniref:Uncharacterized protein n=1 Tax=Urochloa decumbens TaxID=240449 RepID=A0ABC9D384_9POAL